MNLNDYRDQCHKTAKEKGWWDGNRPIPELLCLVHSEISEALEAYRKNDALGFNEEIADVLIRIFDMAGGLGIDLDSEVLYKMHKNKGRLRRHGGKVC